MPDGDLPSRWTRLKANAAGVAYSNSPHRFNTVSAGRRSGKTERFKRKLILRAIEAATPHPPRFFAAAPTRDQAKQIYWEDLKLLTPRYALADISESDLIIYMVNGAEVHVLGMDKPQRVEGRPWDGGGLDEFANMKPQTWSFHVRPALADRKGWCDFIGVPEGRNHYYDLVKKARAQMQEHGEQSEWGAYTWHSSEILDESEIEALRDELDELTFQQEMEGSFINFQGRVYYKFSEDTHTAPLRKFYNDKGILNFCFDFNVDPGVCAIVQEGTLGTLVLGEVYIERNSNTPAVCRALLSKNGEPTIWAKHKGLVRCYGDATGGARGTAKLDGSDWDLIKQELKPTYGDRLSFRLKTKNPTERARINAMNTRLRSAKGSIHMFVDAAFAPHVVKDLEGVQYLKGGSGEIDKKIAPMLTHLSDAIGYYVDYEFPVADKTMRRLELGGV